MTRADSVVAAEFDRSVIPLLLSHRGALYLHASGVVTDAGVVAICGRSGSGKSTLAAALAARGHGVWADDAVVIDPSPSPPVSIHLGSPLRLDAQSVALVGGGPAGVRPVLVRGDVRPLAGIVVLQRRAGIAVPEFVRLSGGAGLASVLEHALCFSLRPSDRADLVSRFLAVLAWAPVERLRFTADASDFARLVDVRAPAPAPRAPAARRMTRQGAPSRGPLSQPCFVLRLGRADDPGDEALADGHAAAGVLRDGDQDDGDDAADALDVSTDRVGRPGRSR